MIGKTKTGRGFKGTVYYCLNITKDPEILDMNGLSHTDAKGITHEFVAVSSDKQSISKPVWHSSLSFAREDSVTPDKMVEIANKFIQQLGFSKENNQWLIIKHNDRDHTHCHIIANRVGFDGKAVSDYYFKSKTVQVAKELEKEYNLVVTQDLAKQKRMEESLLNVNDIDRNTLKDVIDRTLRQPGINTFQKFGDSLKRQGIDMQVICHSKTGIAYGITFKSKDKVFKGSDLGKKYTLKGLSAKLTLAHSQIPALKVVRIAAKIISKGLEMGM